jgi:Cholesterol oxidase, substrate-binding
VEIIWFPFSWEPPSLMDPVNPWLHVWTVSPEKPPESIEVNKPYNYPFADNVPTWIQNMLPTLLRTPGVTPLFGYTSAKITANGLKGEDMFGNSGAYPVSSDIWGPSKNTLLYIQDSTLRVMANGYAIHLKKSDVQEAVAAFTSKFCSMLEKYQRGGEYPINSPLEIRVTGLDNPAEVHLPPGQTARSPALAATIMDAMDVQNGWDVALWFDVLTIPGTPNADNFYSELEQWLLTYFSDPKDGAAGRVMPEWSKGFAYSKDNDAWTDPGFLEHVRQTYDDDWAFALTTLVKYDQSQLFWSPFLDQLFQPA